MEDKRILELIIRVQNGEEQATLELLHAFTPLLKKYACKLDQKDWCDFYCEFQLEFLEVAKSLCTANFQSDYQVLAYLKRCVYNSYLKKSIRLDQELHLLYFQQYSEEQAFQFERAGATYDSYFEDSPITMVFLTEMEYQTVYRLYILGFTVQEIAEQYGITRQAVKATKVRALGKIRSRNIRR